LRIRLLGLAERAGARVLGAYEWGLADKTRKANAALAGIGSTRRILVSDTMLAEYSDDEIEVVMAHELAHHVHGDIWKGIVFESLLIVLGFYLAARGLHTLAAPIGLRHVADVAGLPLLLLAAGAVALVMAPVAHAVSAACGPTPGSASSSVSPSTTGDVARRPSNSKVHSLTRRVNAVPSASTKSSSRSDFRPRAFQSTRRSTE